MWKCLACSTTIWNTWVNVNKDLTWTTFGMCMNKCCSLYRDIVTIIGNQRLGPYSSLPQFWCWRMDDEWKCPLCGVLIPVWIDLDNGRRFRNTSEMDKHMKAHAKGEI